MRAIFLTGKIDLRESEYWVKPVTRRQTVAIYS